MNAERQFNLLGIRNSTFWQPYFFLRSCKRRWPGTDWQIPTVLLYSKDYAGAHYFHEPSRALLRTITERELRAGVYTPEFFKAMHREFESALAKVAVYRDKDFTEASADELIATYDALMEMPQITLFVMVVAHYFSDLLDLFESELRTVLEANGENTDDISELVGMLIYPRTLTFVQREESAYYELLLKLEAGEDVSEGLSAMAKEFGWFHMEYMNEPLTPSQYREALMERQVNFSRDEESPQEKLALVIAEQDEFYAKHPESEFLKEFARVLQAQALILDHSKECLIKGLFFARPAVEEMARRFGVSHWYLALNLTDEETHEALRKGISLDAQAHIRERTKHFALLLQDNEILVHDGDEAEKIKHELVMEDHDLKQQESKGTTAVKGLVRGHARVVTTQKDIADFVQGEVMITRDATTEMTLALAKASAIVSAHGGIISHAAIVAREYGIPCIVGAGTVLEVFKTGDRVEVDASNGVIRKL